MHCSHLGCSAATAKRAWRRHGKQLQKMATQIFVRAAWQRITGSGSAVGFAWSG